MTATIVDQDVAFLVAVDFAPKLPCELLNCQANHPTAEWATRQDAECGCRTFRLCCEPCRKRVLALWRHVADEPGPWRCVRCGTAVSRSIPPTFDPIQGHRR